MSKNLIYVVQFLLAIISLSNSCPTGQVQRSIGGREICCSTVTCKPGQQFKLCEDDQGHDTCQNCPQGYGHKDTIDTSQWMYEVDHLCQPLEDCSSYSDLREENGVCVCDRTRGFYGLDRNLCTVDEDYNCKKAGYQLNQLGDCVKCGEDYYKDKDDYSLCKEKTKCGLDQEVNDPGSHVKDRNCRKKTENLTKPDVEGLPMEQEVIDARESITEIILGTKNGINDRNNTVQKPGDHEKKDNEDQHDDEKNKDSSHPLLYIIFGLVVAALLVIVFVCSWIGFQKMKTRKRAHPAKGLIANANLTCIDNRTYITNDHRKYISVDNTDNSSDHRKYITVDNTDNSSDHRKYITVDKTNNSSDHRKYTSVNNTDNSSHLYNINGEAINVGENPQITVVGSQKDNEETPMMEAHDKF